MQPHRRKWRWVGGVQGSDAKTLDRLRRLTESDQGKRLEVAASDGWENVSEEKAQRSSASVANMNRTAASANPATRLLR